MEKNTCPRHETCNLELIQDDDLAYFLHTDVRILYCPLLECDFTDIRSLAKEAGPFATNAEKLAVTTAARQKVFLKKFVKHLIDDGR